MENAMPDTAVRDPDSDYLPGFGGYHDLMRHKVREILLVSSHYDAFILEEDGGLSEQIFGQYQDLELASPPRVSRVSSASDALEELKKKHYNLIITMTHLFDLDPVEFGKKVRAIQPDIPIILLVTSLADLVQYHLPEKLEGIDKVFFWRGDSSIFMAITKYFEDRANVDEDTEKGQVRVILVVENSARYYSMFLPMIYREVLTQTQGLVSQSLNERERFLRRRARPKILLAENFEEAMEIYGRYRDYIMGVITDVSYPRGGVKDEEAGFRFIESIGKDVPVILQSSHAEHMARAEAMGIPFLDKNSDTLLRDLRRFMKNKFGFGDFVFRLPNGKRVGKASNISELVEAIKTIPIESIRYHGEANQFSNWLMARGEFEFASWLRPRRVSDFKSDNELRQDLLEAVRKWARKKHLGMITEFDQQDFGMAETFTRYGGGSLGGKGRGIAFLAALIRKGGIIDKFPNYHIGIPDTLVVATDEFDRFMAENELSDVVKSDLTDREIMRRFNEGKLSDGLKCALAKYLAFVDCPIAVRSSSLLEDSYLQPFAGIYSTYLLPNNHESLDVRLEQLCQAVKLVYASTFFPVAKAYQQTTSHKAEEEKMAVVIQKLVGNRFGSRFYPSFSGVAQSYNFYPQPPLDRDEGAVSIALGLGKTIGEGGNALTFSPRRPSVIPSFSSAEEMLCNSQKKFYCLDMDNASFDLLDGEDATLFHLNVEEAEPDGTLESVAGVYDINDGIVRNSLLHKGMRIITFSGMLNYDCFPLPGIIKDLLEMGQRGMGGQVEIEFAASLDEEKKPKLYILQIRPFLMMHERTGVRIDDADRANAAVFSKKALGNCMMGNIRDLVFVPPELFDAAKTFDIASEIEIVNKGLSGRPYILMGPGRWGSRDCWLGIPVDWSQISNARVIVETSMENFKVDPSHGSHFFHNITSLGIPYLTVSHTSADENVDWAWLKELVPSPLSKGMKHIRHVNLPAPLAVKVDGRRGWGVVIKPKME